MTQTLVLVMLLWMLPMPVATENSARSEGTIVRMRMADCLSSRHAFMNAMSGANQAVTGEQCPEYVLVTSKVVYVIIGKSSDQLVPLAETTRFRFQNNEVLIRVDDARRESRFHVKEMVLRPEWERNQEMIEAAALAAMHSHLQSAAVVETRH